MEPLSGVVLLRAGAVAPWPARVVPSTSFFRVRSKKSMGAARHFYSLFLRYCAMSFTPISDASAPTVPSSSSSANKLVLPELARSAVAASLAFGLDAIRSSKPYERRGGFHKGTPVSAGLQ